MDLRRTLWIHAWLQLALFIGLAVVANRISSEAFGRWDLTADQRYTLSEVARRTMNKVERPLLARVYYSRDLEAPYNNHREALLDKLEELRAYSGGFMEIEELDVDGDPEVAEEAQREGIQPIQYRFKSYDRSEVKTVFLGVSLLYGQKALPLDGLVSIETFEYELVRGIKKLTTDLEDVPVVGWLRGYGAPDPTTQPEGSPLAALWKDLAEQYGVTPVDLGGDEGVPDEVDALLIIGPQQRLPLRAQYQIDQFLMRGGSIAAFLGTMRPDFEAMRAVPVRHDLDALLAHYGVRLQRDTILDREHNEVFPVPVKIGGRVRRVQVNYPLIPVTNDFERSSPIVNRLDRVLLPFASSLELEDDLGPNLDGQVIVRTLPESTRVESLRYLAPEVFRSVDPAEEQGSFPVAAQVAGRFRSFFTDRPIPPPVGMAVDDPSFQPDPASKIIDGAPARLVVVSSADFSANNLPFVFNAVDWMTGDTDLLAIRTELADVDVLEPPPRATVTFWRLGIVGVPLALLLLLGLVVFLSNRRSTA